MCSSAHVEEFSATNLMSHEGLKFTCASVLETFQNEPLLSLVPFHLGFKQLIIVLFLFFSVPTDLFYRICKLSANLLIYNKILFQHVVICYFSYREHAAHGRGGIPVLLKARGL